MPSQPSASMSFGGIARLALLGATVATVCDAVHVQTSTLSYPRPFLWGQAAFVFPGFVGAFVLMSLTYVGLVNRLPEAVPRTLAVEPGRGRDLAVSLSLFAVVYLLSGLGNHQPIWLAGAFYSTALARVGLAPDRAFMAILACLLAVAGMAGEGTMTVLDLVHYREPEVFGVPVWLGGLYMHGAFALRDGMRCFVYGRA